ncbi:apolipoprotein Da, duplicate 2 [Pseudoliparis swirei]|uniref:apolipoprotein Da, duplicate 2 n=1 Tax=Pseudoliparis swirei TaxID=2059687 RepID=UPI0024BED5E9|nr:apolipoprotein Da, duplicate 2 [Pseudoliparis swirei]
MKEELLKNVSIKTPEKLRTSLHPGNTGCGGKMNAIQVISLTLLSALAVNAQVLMPGRCPKLAVQENFDTARYLGKWYDVQRLPHAFQKGECCTATYSLKSPGVVGVFNSELLLRCMINVMILCLLQVSFFENAPHAPYWVLSTDYDTYSLVYSCTDLGVMHMDFAWILSREPTLPEETLEELHSTLSSIGVRVDKLLTTSQDAAYCSAMNQ